MLAIVFVKFEGPRRPKTFLHHGFCRQFLSKVRCNFYFLFELRRQILLLSGYFSTFFWTAFFKICTYLLILNKRNLITTAYGNAIINLWSKKVVPKKVATKKWKSIPQKVEKWKSIYCLSRLLNQGQLYYRLCHQDAY